VQCTPDHAFKLFQERRDAVTDEAFFNDPAHQWLRDLWTAAHYGRAYSKFIDECSLEFDWDRTHEWDFKLHVTDSVYPFQTTETLEPGRRRGYEYRQIARKERPATVLESWEPGTENGPEWIAAAITRKKKKNYSGVEGLNLLVYANFPAYELEFERVVRACAEEAEIFSSVWVITGNLLGQVSALNHEIGQNQTGWLVINESPTR